MVNAEDTPETYKDLLNGKECSEESNRDMLWGLKQFSEYLVKALGTIDDLLERILIKHLDCKIEDRKDTVLGFACYRVKEACYGLDRLIREKCETKLVTDFNSDCSKIRSARYSEVEIDKNKFENLLIDGWVFTKYKGIGVAIQVSLYGMSPNVTIRFNKKDVDTVNEFVEEYRGFMRKHNFLRGKKLKIIDGYYFHFLDYPKISINEVILKKEVWDEIFLNIVFPLKNRELCRKHKVPWRRGVLLGGEPGTGKTKLAKLLCNTLDKVTVIWVSSESLSDSTHVRALFDAARYLAPTLIVMEDIDFFGRDREIERSPIVGELLNQLDGNSPNNGVFVMASSNRPGLLDKALANRPGRFDVKLEVELPDKECRLKMLHLFSKGKILDADVDLEALSGTTDGLTGAHIQESLVYATLDSLHNKKDKVTMKSITKAINRMKDRPKNKLTR